MTATTDLLRAAQRVIDATKMLGPTSRAHCGEVLRAVNVMAGEVARSAAAGVAGFVIEHADGGRWRTLDTIGMPDWTDDIEKALMLTKREHADAYAADDPEDVRIKQVSGDPQPVVIEEHKLTPEQINEFRRHPGNFDAMVQAIFDAGRRAGGVRPVNYEGLCEFALRNRISYNDLCKAVRIAVGSSS